MSSQARAEPSNTMTSMSNKSASHATSRLVSNYGSANVASIGIAAECIGRMCPLLNTHTRLKQPMGKRRCKQRKATQKRDSGYCTQSHMSSCLPRIWKEPKESMTMLAMVT